MVAVGFFYRVEICPLEVLDHGQREQRAIIGFANDRRDLVPPQSRRSAKSSLAGNELVAGAIRRRTHGDGLQQPADAKAGFEVSEVLGIELVARLVRIGADLRDRNSAQSALRCLFGSRSTARFCRSCGGHRVASDVTTRQERVEPSAKSARCFGRIHSTVSGVCAGCVCVSADLSRVRSSRATAMYACAPTEAIS